MVNSINLDDIFNQYMQNLSHSIPDGVVNVDLALLQKFGLLNYQELGESPPSLTRYFHVIESKDKITLYNEQFVIWIVPHSVDNEPTTYTLIALRNEKTIQLEMAFATSGVYNTSKLVLRILEKFLQEIQENEELITRLDKVC